MKYVIILLIFLAGCAGTVPESDTGQDTVEPEVDSDKEPEAGQETENMTYNMSNKTGEPAEEMPDIMKTEDGTKYLVHPDELASGGPPKDGIPSIDNPEFVPMNEADKWIEDNELILGLSYKGREVVYPLQIMVWHEIVNDNVAGDSLLITYCPLCGTGLAYKRTLDGEAVEFGVSGKLYNSNLVMYDRKTDSYWSQIGGRAIVGELTGMELEKVSIDTVSWEDWKKGHSESKVLSRETGFDRRYGNDPYGNYYENSFVLFPVENENESVEPKTVIFGVEVNGTFKAYRESDLQQVEVINDTVGGVQITIAMNENGEVKVTRNDKGEQIVKERSFWFAWYAFHPDTRLY